MAGEVYEWYGYRAADRSAEAIASAATHSCPFVPPLCTKVGGVCSVRPQASQEVITVCPKRMYFRGHEFLRSIAHQAFPTLDLALGSDGLPTLVSGPDVRGAAASNGTVQVGVFGQGWAGEVKLPSAVPGGARYSVDFTLVAVDPGGDLQGFVAVEVQSIDTTGSYSTSVAALEEGRRIVPSTVGMNWENVNKRILPQLIVKGLMLQGERLCTTGMYFVTPEPVFNKIMARLGGGSRLRRIPPQPGSITFIPYQHHPSPAADGHPVELARSREVTISTSDMSLAFISPENLPPAGSYEQEIVRRF